MAKRLIVGLVGLCLIATAAWAADPKDPAITPGTVITAQNWQQYKDFMPVGLQRILQGDTVWSLPPGWQMDVGPTVDYPVPRQWWAATEKYKNQTRLVKLDTGGYTVQGYKAGTPFPDYSGPEAGYKLLYNLYYHYIGAANYYRSVGYAIDRYLNTSETLSYQVYLQFTHLVDPGFSGYAQEMPGYFASYYNELEAPEQSRYTTPLFLIFDDPQKLPEFYVFLPSLRRSLRLSAGARCAPYAGTDYVGDDTYWGVPLPVGWFEAKFVGHKKMLMFRPTPDNRGFYNVRDNYYPRFLFPKPVIGKWQVFDAVVLDLSRVPSVRSGYCYGLRRLYADPRTWNVIWIDLYDAGQKFWKLGGYLQSAHPIPGGGYLPEAAGVNWAIDFQNLHASMALVGGDVFAVNQEVPKQFFDVTRYGSPAGLVKIMR